MSEGSGWSSWGNWISSTVSSVVETSSQVVQDLTSAVDDSEEKVTKPSGGLKLYRTDEEVKKEEEERNAPDFEDKIIQRTTDVVRDTSNLVSSLFQEGMTKVRNVDMDGLIDQAGTYGRSTKDVGQQFVHQTAGALGLMSNRAKDILGLSEHDQAPSETSSESVNDNSGSTEVQKKEIKPTFAYHFDEYMGNVHLQALELLSTECTMKVQEIQRKSDPTVLQELVTYLQMISEKFEDDDDADESVELELPDKVSDIQKNTKKIEQEADKEMNSLLEDFKTQAAALVNPESLSAVVDKSDESDDTESNANEEKSNEESEKESTEETPKAEQKVVNDEDILIFVQNYLEKLHSQELLVLAKLSASAVEFINRLVEHWLVESQQKNQEEETTIRSPELTLQKAAFLMNLTNSLADDISAVTTNFVHICRSISSQSEETFSQKHENILPSIKEKTKTLINTIYVDTGDAIAKVHESKDFTIPVLQRIYILSESLLASQ